MGIAFVEHRSAEQTAESPDLDAGRQVHLSSHPVATTSDRHRLMTSILKALSLRAMSRRRTTTRETQCPPSKGQHTTVQVYVTWTDGRSTRSLISFLANFGTVTHWELFQAEPGFHPCVAIWFATDTEAQAAAVALTNLAGSAMGLPRFYASMEEAPLVPSASSSLCSLPTPELAVSYLA